MNMSGPVSIRGPLIIRGPSEHQGPLTNRGPPNCQGPSEYYSTLMGCFKLGDLKIPTFYLSFHFFVNLGPSRKIVGQSVDFLVLGRGYLRPWKPPPPPPPLPNPSYVPVPGYYFVSYGWMYLTAPPYTLTRLKMNNYPIPIK